MKWLLASLASALLALSVVAGVAAPAAAAAPAAPAVQPTTAKADIWGAACAITLATPVGPLACGAKVAKESGLDEKVATELSQSFLAPLAEGTAQFVSDLMKTGLTWWLTTESVSIKDSGVMDTPQDPSSKASLHAIMLGIGVLIAILMAIFAGIRTIIQRRGQPIVQLVQGLIMNVLVISVGVAVIDSLLVASDKLTEGILQVGFGESDAPEKMVAMLLPHMGNPAALLLMALIVLMIGGIQVVLLFLRQAAIPIQALLLPIAGAGQMGAESARQWLPRLMTAIMTIICYKPMAALIITVGFVEIDNSTALVDWLRGVVTLVLSVVALKGLLAVFSPIGIAMGTAAAGGGFAPALAQAGAALTGGGTGGSAGSMGSSATDQASHMDRHGPASSADNGSTSDSSQGDSAVRQAGSNIPAQQGDAEAAQGTNAAGQGAATSSQTGAASSSSGAAAGGSGASAGPVAIAVVAAEATKKGLDKGSNTYGKGD